MPEPPLAAPRDWPQLTEELPANKTVLRTAMDFRLSTRMGILLHAGFLPLPTNVASLKPAWVADILDSAQLTMLAGAIADSTGIRVYSSP